MAVKRRTIEPFTPVVITWVDAVGSGSGSHTNIAECLASYKPCIRHTVGYYIGYAKRDGERALILASDDDRTPENQEAIGATIDTPASLIRKIEVIGAVKSRAKR